MNKNLRIYLDLEYCFPEMSPTSGRPTNKNKRQIVQIAAILFDVEKGVEIDSLNILVKPKFTTTLPPFFIELTNIKQEEVDTQGLEFPSALEKLVKFINEYNVWTFDADWSVLDQNCSYFNINNPFQDSPFTKVKTLLPTWNINPEEYSSGSLYKAVGLEMDGHVHNALHDVRSMAKAIYHLEH